MKKVNDATASPNMLVTKILEIFFFAIIGILILSVILSAGEEDNQESFSVEDPSVDKVCNLDDTPKGDVVVQYYNGTAWKTLVSSDYTLSGSVLTVAAAAMN